MQEVTFLNIGVIQQKMEDQTCVDESKLQQLEQKILNQVMEVSKSMIESFKFQLICDLKVTNEQQKKTLSNLKEFREKNWDKTVSKKEAYEKYINLYH